MSAFQAFLDTISPKEAEAKVVVPDETDPIQHVLKAMEQGTVDESKLKKDDYAYKGLVSGKSNPAARYVYQMILKAAEADPDTVTIGSKRSDEEPGAKGFYDKESKHINVKSLEGLDMSKYPAYQGYQNTASHELLHFLLRDITKSTSSQHAFIENTLGTPSGATNEDLMKAVPFQAPSNSPVINKDVYETWKRKVFGGGYTDDQLALEKKSNMQRFLDWFMK